MIALRMRESLSSMVVFSTQVLIKDMLRIGMNHRDMPYELKQRSSY